MRVVEGDQLDHSSVKLVLIADGRGAAFQIADIGAFVGDNQRAFELARLGGVDAEVSRELHRAAHALGHINKGPVAEDRGIQRGEEVVGVGHHGAQVLLHQLGMILHCLGKRAEDHPVFGELRLESCGHRDAVEDRIHGDAGQHLLLIQRNAQLLVGPQDLGIELIQALQLRLLLRGGVIRDSLIVDRADT